MSRLLAQASPTNPGSSRSADFQPPTGNPQSLPGQVFPDSPTIQNQTSDEILQNGNAQISVPSGNSAPATRQVTEAKSGDWLIWLVVALVIAIIALGVWLAHRNTRSGTAIETEDAPEPAPLPIEKPVKIKAAPVKPPKKKPSPRKSKSQRKKRARKG